MSHLEAVKSRAYLLKLLQSVTQDGERSSTAVFLSSRGCGARLVGCARAEEQLVHVVLWRRAYSRRIAYVGVSLV